MAIEFGMLQQVKSKGLMAKGPQANQFKQNLAKIENIFNQHEAYKAQLGQAEQNGGATASTTENAFGSTSMSESELQAKIAECEAQFAQYYAVINEQSKSEPTGSPENKDEKNKIPPKNFSGLMA